MCSDLGARLGHLNQKFRLHDVCIREINPSFPSVCLRDSKNHNQKVEIPPPPPPKANTQLFLRGQLGRGAAELSGQQRPLLRVQIRNVACIY